MVEDICEKYGIKPISALVNRDLTNKIVLLRVDFNVPISGDNIIIDTTRIQSAIETINYLIARNAKIVLISHLSDNLSFQPILKQIIAIIGHTINLISLQSIIELTNNITLLDNIRLYPGEKRNDIDFAKMLLQQLKINIYINDGFSVCHREHTSIVILPQLIDEKYAGHALLNELIMLERTLGNAFTSNKCITAIIGGKKVATKILLLQKLCNHVSNICIVGGMANTFLKALNIDIDQSFYEPDMLKIASDILKSKAQIILPIDVLCDHNQIINTIEINNQIKGAICDIGPQTTDLIHKTIILSDIVLWNGPAGICEDLRFRQGSQSIAASLSQAKQSVIGGGDTISVINQMAFKPKIDYISNGGGAFMSWLCDNFLPGIKALQNNHKYIKS